MEEKLTLEEVNRLTKEQFISKFSGIIEQTEEASAKVEQLRPLASINEVVNSFQQYLDTLSLKDKTVVLQKHPELGAKVDMSQHSINEQKTSGVASMAIDLSQKLATLNKQYKDKFGFPFVICVKENTPQTILKSVETRLNNSLEEEINTGIDQVKKISEIRIRQFIKEK